MLRCFSFVLLSSILFSCQPKLFTVRELPSVPKPVSNQSIAIIESPKGEKILYSFYGLDSTKNYAGIHNETYKYSFDAKKWTKIENLISNYDTLGRLASAANVLQNKIYLVGGYAVFEDNHEKSSDFVFEIDELGQINQKKTFLHPIDDHVQAVWKDSLLYVITGWSDSTNISNVQVFNPKENEWREATPVPDEASAKVFGAAGAILGDTIYCLGGAQMGKNYPLTDAFYKGVINPQNPTEIKWQKSNYPLPFRYRSGCFVYQNAIYWLGGSAVPYNYNAMAYDKSGGVETNKTMLKYENGNFQLIKLPKELQIMDIRNIAQLSENQFVVVGGIIENQKVSDKVFLITFKGSVKYVMLSTYYSGK